MSSHETYAYLLPKLDDMVDIFIGWYLNEQGANEGHLHKQTVRRSHSLFPFDVKRTVRFLKTRNYITQLFIWDIYAMTVDIMVVFYSSCQV